MAPQAPPLQVRLAAALAARVEAGLFDAAHETAVRAFNGFTEGWPNLSADLYARTLVLHNYADPPERAAEALRAAQEHLLAALPWLRAVVVKPRHAPSPRHRRGAVVYGETLDHSVREGGVWYAVDLLLHQDAGLYLDTRDLRAWARTQLAGKAVLNAFAYTGSLGVAARAGGAGRVVQLDRSRAFLSLAKASYALNGFPVDRRDFVAGDFWIQTSRLRRAGALFDCVFLDPPFFAQAGTGTVDLARDSTRLINKVRPLVADGGWLVAINNALFVSGADYLRSLEVLCADGYLSIEALIPVPPDFTGYPATRVGTWPADPAPFNHPTKIAVLRVRRRDR